MPSPFAMAQAALQQSIGEPPPRAIAKSALISRIILTQESTLSVVGFARTSLKIFLILPPLIFTNSSATPFFVKLFPQTSTPFLPPRMSIYFSISFLFPLPKTSFTGSINSHSISLSPFKKSFDLSVKLIIQLFSLNFNKNPERRINKGLQPPVAVRNVKRSI